MALRKSCSTSSIVAPSQSMMSPMPRTRPTRQPSSALWSTRAEYPLYVNTVPIMALLPASPAGSARPQRDTASPPCPDADGASPTRRRPGRIRPAIPPFPPPRTRQPSAATQYPEKESSGGVDSRTELPMSSCAGRSYVPRSPVDTLGSVVTSALSRFFVRFVLGESDFRRQ